ncbi:MAG: YraN family protein, partial [Candidatus Dormibacteraeota bacterium]|nr:YraN family protein [Candidatus Dormibacteraeota bacterium]
RHGRPPRGLARARAEPDPPDVVGADPSRAGRLRAARALGHEGEAAAADLLRRRGYRVVGQGFLARRGEVDLVCRRGDRLVLVEVKTRTTSAFGAPVEAIGARKRRALRAAAAEYRALAEWRGPIEFAVVAIQVGAEPELIEEPF